MQDDELVFAQDDEPDEQGAQSPPWVILLVDDEEEVHHVTQLVLQDFTFDGRKVELLFARSAGQAQKILQQAPRHEIAVAMIDVVMETHHAGLELIRWIREKLNNHAIRLIIRTGQPGEAPEENVIRDYDINDYKSKTELTALRLKSMLYTALRGFRDISTLEHHRLGLEKIIAATTHFIECDSLQQFASSLLDQIAVVLELEAHNIVCCAATSESQTGALSDLTLLAANPNATLGFATDIQDVKPHIRTGLELALKQKHSIQSPHCFVGYYATQKGTESLLYVAHEGPLLPVQHHLLGYFTHNLAVAHENLKLRETIRESQKELSYIIGEAVEVRSKETGSHVRRVADCSYLLAKYYGLDEQEAEMIRLASPLHDVGKVGIPDVILNKPGRHTSQESNIMRTHAEIGYEMLKDSANPILQLGARIAFEHHECWNGGGYPRGLAGKDIHIAGRISAVADVFDALGSRRCYKQPWPMDDIIRYFEQKRGQAFEPRLVDILIDHISEFAAIRRQYPDLH
ncbi:DUF3369 domain-containing protein [Alteromonas aestuariivivens]|uniref:DUF3369 domain-containing protein n=2 Tax=Alteromonas aestuariivivens TaxID=1938339 RepID=A0A3D8M3N9_9ALTE|nr:DUF3369 domain-containing protein [Alteromonas aestuariivivens]